MSRTACADMDVDIARPLLKDSRGSSRGSSLVKYCTNCRESFDYSCQQRNSECVNQNARQHLHCRFDFGPCWSACQTNAVSRCELASHCRQDANVTSKRKGSVKGRQTSLTRNRPLLTELPVASQTATENRNNVASWPASWRRQISGLPHEDLVVWRRP